MEKGAWKTIAIIFIIIFILQTSLVILIVKIALNDIAKEDECSINVCSDSDAYKFDTYESMCYCYKNGELDKQQFIR